MDPAGLYGVVDRTLTLMGWPAGSLPGVQLVYVLAWPAAVWGLVLIGRTFRKDW